MQTRKAEITLTVKTTMSKEAFEAFLKELLEDYQGTEYHTELVDLKTYLIPEFGEPIG